jgi:hypothetical protein
MARRRQQRICLACAALCIIAGLGLLGLNGWASQITTSGRPRALWRAAPPGLDLGIDVQPATIGQGGYVELWAYPHDADDYLPLLRLPGAPARPRRWQPGEVTT